MMKCETVSHFEFGFYFHFTDEEKLTVMFYVERPVGVAFGTQNFLKRG